MLCTTRRVSTRTSGQARGARSVAEDGLGPRAIDARRAHLVVWAFLSCAFASTVWAHIEVGEKNLIGQVAEAEVIVHARVEESGKRFRSRDGSVARPVVRARVVETLKGGASFDALVFAQHGHGVAEYRVGEEAVFFLDRLGRDGELAALADLPGAPTHVSRQEHDDAYRLEPDTRAVLLTAVRDLVRAQSPAAEPGAASDAAPSPTATERRALTRRAVLGLLTSGDPRLGSSVLATLGAVSETTLIEAADVPRLLAVVRDGKQSVGYRGALLVALESLGLVEGSGEWRALVESAPPRMRGTALRAAGQSASPEVVAYLVGLVDTQDPRIAEEAAIALGRPGRREAVPALGRALERDDARLRGASIRALTTIGGKEAREVLLRAASSHPDAATRNRARAAAQRLPKPRSRMP